MLKLCICIYTCHRGNKPELLGRNIDEKVAIATVYGVFKDFYSDYIDLTYGNYQNSEEFRVAV